MKEFKKRYTLNAAPQDVYNAMTNPLMIEIWTGEPVVMSTEPGSVFEIWDGAITGENMEFVQDKLIVQRWFFGEEEDSIVTIKLHPDRKGTLVELHQTNIPDNAWENMVEGWDLDYFGNLRQLYG
ncbi:MAG TPA: SRPBCC domain-containing protein [Prolixibacteraceae bacterium]|nr:SRPBCC domain-containing protein [Prolixibacteraceae bacterium]